MLPIEIDELYREMHALQHRTSELESRLNALEGRQALSENAQTNQSALNQQQDAVNQANVRSHEQIMSVLDAIKNAFVELSQIGKPTEDDNENDAKISEEWKGGK